MRYDNSYFTASISGFTANGTNPLTGEGLSSIAPDSMTISLRGKLPDYGLQIGARATITAEQNDVPEESVTTEGYKTVDLFASWSPESGAFQNTVLSLAIDNIFDEDYTIHPTVIRQPGRSFRVNISHQF